MSVESLNWLTYKVNFGFGGMNGSPNLDVVPAEAFIHPSKNLNHYAGGRERRGGTVPVGSTIVGTPTILNVFQFRKTSGSSITVHHCSDGKIYSNYTTILQTGRSTVNRGEFLYYRDNFYFVDGANAPQKSDGSTIADLTNLTADWSGSNYPQKILKHGRNASERIWAFQTPNNLDSLYYTNTGTDNFVAGGKLRIDTGDGYGLVAGGEFGRQLIVLGKYKSFIIVDDDPSTANWGYETGQFNGGCANPQLLVRTPNDLISMMADGEIYSVTTAQEYGDYRSASLTRPAYMDRWIADNINLARINQFHALYDPGLRCVYFFMVYSGESTVQLALVFYIDREPKDAWTVHDNLSSPSGYNAVCSASLFDSVGRSIVYAGDSGGKTWQLNQSTKSDNSNGYQFAIRTPQLSFDNPRESKLYRGVRLTINPKGNYNLTMEWWVDGVSQGTKTLTASTQAGAYGSGMYDVSVYGGQEISELTAELGQVGKRIQFEFRNSNAGEDFFISQLMVDFESLGMRY